MLLKVEHNEKREVAVGLVNMKDAGNIDGITMGGMEWVMISLCWVEETEPVCESLEFGRKVGTRESALFACSIFLRGKVLSMFVC